MTEPQIYKGLAGVTADTTAISKVNPETNSLLYRGYPVQELAAAVDFDQVLRAGDGARRTIKRNTHERVLLELNAGSGG